MAAMLSASALISSEAATSAEAAPPNPLNNATISGMEVISTRLAITAPTMDPTANPAMISGHPRTPPSAPCMRTTVMITASSMPIEPSWFPRTAVLGDPRYFRPKMKSAAEIR